MQTAICEFIIVMAVPPIRLVHPVASSIIKAERPDLIIASTFFETKN